MNQGEVVVYLKGDGKHLTAEIKNAEGVVSSFTKTVDKQTGSVQDKFRDFGKKLTGAGQKLSLAITAPIAAVTAFSVKSASDMEQWGVSFETMLGSVERGQKLLSDIKDFARITPFNQSELIEGAKKLLAYNIEAGKIIPTLSSLGNIAAGVGMDKLPQLILAFGQVRLRHGAMGGFF